MKNLIAIIIILTMTSCSVALVEVESINTRILDGKYTFQNDTIKVDYDFWFNQGVMSFSVTNMLGTPLYIDWKKCSFLLGNKKFDYWRDLETRKTIGLYNVYSIGTPSYFSSTTITKPERITFLPPGAKANFATFLLTAKDEFNETMELIENDSQIEYSPNDSPLNFSNFLTYSTSEIFIKESYLKNNFHISQIKIMRKQKFNGSARDPGNTMESPYLNPRRFFINL